MGPLHGAVDPLPHSADTDVLPPSLGLERVAPHTDGEDDNLPSEDGGRHAGFSIEFAAPHGRQPRWNGIALDL